ncbi:MAG: glycosyltransferase family 39 protein, partial [Acidobacteria bacterium]|nr:glycosyltransferase family 39 protein [Acidobacteriota bacterium]
MIWWATIGVLIGVAYTVSPITVLFALLLPLLFWWAARGIDAPDRRRVVGLLALAALLRVAAIAVLLLTTSPAQHYNTFFPDAHYAIARSLWVRNTWLDVTIGPQYRVAMYDPYGRTSYTYVLAFIQLLVGPSPYGLNFVSITAFLTGAIALYRIARESFGSAAALVAFVIILFWPTTFVWSVTMLKESMQFGLTALLISFAFRTVRSRTWRARVTGGVLALATAYAIATLRSAALGIAVSGVAVGV